MKTKEEKDLIVKKSRNGRGVFARRQFEVGEIVYVVTGSLVSGDIDEDISDTVRDNLYRFDCDTYISSQGTLGDFFNHSCEPNTKIEKIKNILHFVAIKVIKKGEEVTFDYSTLIAKDDMWEMVCNCGSMACRKKVTQFYLLPQKIQKKYITHTMVPGYILD
jgi:SET domain-containing protein